jgi:hypothetical protein
MSEQRKPIGRPRLPEGEGKLYSLGLRTVWENYQAVTGWAAASGRSVAQEIERSIEFRRWLQGAYPPALAALLELLGRTMLEVGETVEKANRWSGHGEKPWIDDPYAWNQAVTAAQHILQLSRHEGGEPHGLFASSDYPENLAKELGVQSADGILEVMRGRHEPEPGRTTIATQWTPQIRERLGSIGDRLDRHPSPPEYNVTTNVRLGPSTEAPQGKSR